MHVALPIAFLGFLLASSALAIPQREPDGEPDPRLVIAVDRRFELLSILHRLAGTPEYRRAPKSPYVEAVDAHFATFAKHKAVQRTRELRAAFGISYDAPMSFAARLDPATLALRGPLEPRPAGLDKRWSAAPIAEYAELVASFAQEAKLDEFLSGQRVYAAGVEQRYREALRGVAPVRWFDSYFGPLPQARFRLVPSLLNGQNNYGVHAAFEGGALEVYQVLGMTELDDQGLPELGSGLEGLLVHELAHSYVNPAVERRWDELEQPFDRARRLVAKEMQAQAYGNTSSVASESVVRAATTLYMLELRGEQAAAAQLGYEEGRSFLWTQPLFEELRAGRAKEAPAAQRWPEVLHAVGERLSAWLELPEAQRRPLFRGPINAVYRWRAKDTMVVVLPPERNQSASVAAFEAYVREVHASFYAKQGVPLARAGEALALDSARAQVLYGTPQDGPHIAVLLTRLGAAFDEQGLKLGADRFEGAGIALIACAAHELDPRAAPRLVYAAADHATLVGINAHYHGPTDWLVVRRIEDGKFETLASGRWPAKLSPGS
ncbi:MAG: DUF4932 domain-containing protein [Planctomycetes bacterium]|nr:DUF4932 domain-containing protein [Planctomycetota bacterium]